MISISYLLPIHFYIIYSLYIDVYVYIRRRCWVLLKVGGKKIHHLPLHIPLIKHLPRLALQGAMNLELRKNRLIVLANEDNDLKKRHSVWQSESYCYSYSHNERRMQVTHKRTSGQIELRLD